MIWWTAALGADCTERLAREAFDARLVAAEEAWLALDGTRFRDETNVLSGLVVPCMGDLVPPDLAARWHRLMAVHLDALGETAASDRAVAAAHTLSPDLDFGEDWVGADHHLRAAWDAAAAPKTRSVPAPRSGSLVFDGVVSRDRPVDAPALVQVFDDAGVAQATAYVGPGGTLPPYPAVPRARNRFLGAAAGSVVAGGVAFAAAFGAQRALFAESLDPKTPGDELTALRNRANLLSAVGSGLVGVGVGFGVGAALAPSGRVP